MIKTIQGDTTGAVASKEEGTRESAVSFPSACEQNPSMNFPGK
jgi:hypothetical protein